MPRSLVAFASLWLAACLAPFGEAHNPSDGSTSEITFSEEYGFCPDRCYSEISMAADGHARVILRSRRGGTVLSDRTVSVPRAETARVFALAADAADEGWEAQYGCPDCADQGRYELLVRSGGDEQRTVLDPTDHPATFDALVDALRTVLHRELP